MMKAYLESFQSWVTLFLCFVCFVFKCKNISQFILDTESLYRIVTFKTIESDFPVLFQMTSYLLILEMLSYGTMQWNGYPIGG